MSFSQVVQVLRAIDRDEGGNDSTVYFNIPPESSASLNFSIRESGGVHCFFAHTPTFPLFLFTISYQFPLPVSIVLRHFL